MLTSHLPGEIAEVGVYKGGSAFFIAQYSRNKPLHLFDTFSGLPEPCEHDLHKQGEFSDTTLEDVRAQMSVYPNVVFHAGLFAETCPAVADKRFSFVHLDGDLYDTTDAGLRFFYPRMTPGGIIMLDDFLRPSCPGVEKAVFDFMEDKPENVEIVGDRRRCQARIKKL